MTLPPPLMRRIARQAGVHVWLESDDAIYTDGRFIGVHAAADGTKRVSLPFVGQAADVLNGTSLSCDGRTVTFEMKRAETVLLDVQPR
jgi:hypothetical protein